MRVKLSCLCGLVLLAGAVSCLADSVTFDPGTLYIIDPSLSGFSTYPGDMVGMIVTAYADGSSQAAAWGAPGQASVANMFSVSESGDTYGGIWNLTNLSTTDSLTRLVLFGPPGGTVFDTTFGSVEGTPGSALGWTFQRFDGTFQGSADATYRNVAALIGNSAVGDLYTTLDISFAGGIAPGGTFSWISDTDMVPAGGTIAPVPEPASVLLLGSICAALFALRRKWA